MVKSMDCTHEEVKALGNSVLGLGCNPVEDVLSFKIVPTMVIEGKKRKKVRMIMTKTDVKDLRSAKTVLTRRMALFCDGTV